MTTEYHEYKCKRCNKMNKAYPTATSPETTVGPCQHCKKPSQMTHKKQECTGCK